MGKYYREPEPSKGPIPAAPAEPLVRSFRNDHYVEDTGDIVFYKQDPNFWPDQACIERAANRRPARGADGLQAPPVSWARLQCGTAGIGAC